MLIRFAITNFLSFKERTEFNMLTGNYKTHKEHVIESTQVDVLRTAAIYGANGSGKSNLVIAFDFIKSFVTGELRKENPLRLSRFKLDDSFKDKPTSFEIELLLNETIYFYKISVHKSSLKEESLYKTDKNEDVPIFERIQESKKYNLQVNESLISSDKDQVYQSVLSEIIEDDQSFLGFSKAREKYSAVKEVFEWFDDNFSVVHPTSTQTGMIKSYYYEDEYKNIINSTIKTLGIGIDSLDFKTSKINKEDYNNNKEFLEAIETIEQGENIALMSLGNGEEGIALIEDNTLVLKRLVTLHTTPEGKNVPFNFTEESDGTIRLFDLLPLIKLLSTKTTVIIDEIDRSIHPHLIKTFIDKLINDTKIKGQLIFTTHESNLLDLKVFRQDEIWFAEKDECHATHFYPLSEFNPRYDLDIRKGYLNGRYGAIPFLANLNALNWTENVNQ